MYLENPEFVRVSSHGLGCKDYEIRYEALKPGDPVEYQTESVSEVKTRINESVRHILLRKCLISVRVDSWCSINHDSRSENRLEQRLTATS